MRIDVRTAPDGIELIAKFKQLLHSQPSGGSSLQQTLGACAALLGLYGDGAENVIEDDMFLTVTNLLAAQLDEKSRAEINDFLQFARPVSDWLKEKKQQCEEDMTLGAGYGSNLEDLQMKPYFLDVVSKALNDGGSSPNNPQK